MKRMFVMALSCITCMAVAQNDKVSGTNSEPKVTSAKEDNLDGRTFRITLKSKTDIPVQSNTTGTNQAPVNQSGINTGTVQQNTPSGEPVYKSGNTTGNQTTGNTTLDNNKPATGNSMNPGMENTVPANPSTGINTTPGNRTDPNHTIIDNGTAGISDQGNKMNPDMNLDNRTMVISFNDGMLKTDLPSAMIDNNKNNNSTERIGADQATSSEQIQMPGCTYNITSGSGGLSTFSAKCSDSATSRSTAFWNGFINDGAISGNLVVYNFDGTSSRYSFSGKATKKDMPRKATSYVK